MFNYIKETIINDVAKVVESTADELIVKRGGNYKFANIVDGKVFKTEGNAGTKGVITLTVKTLVKDSIYRFTMIVKTPSKSLVDFAYPNWGEFGKVTFVEFKASGVAKDDAARLTNALKLSLQPDNELFSVVSSEATVTITMKEDWMQIAETTFEKYDEAKDVYVVDTAGLTSKIAPENKEAFGTADWITENLRLPTYPNIRYNGMYMDERPVAGTVYDEYSFQYVVKHSVPGGLNSVGEVVNSITTHVFFVPHAQATAFEGKFQSKVSFSAEKTEASSMDPYAKDIKEAMENPKPAQVPGK